MTYDPKFFAVVAEIEEPGGYKLTIWRDDDNENTFYSAVRTAPDGTETTPQTDMTDEACIRYLAHLANGYVALGLDQKAM